MLLDIQRWGRIVGIPKTIPWLRKFDFLEHPDHRRCCLLQRWIIIISIHFKDWRNFLSIEFIRFQILTSVRLKNQILRIDSKSTNSSVCDGLWKNGFCLSHCIRRPESSSFNFVLVNCHDHRCEDTIIFTTEIFCIVIRITYERVLS